jgi:phosphoribosylformimino-5-aminoimidazole carboxamide ribonucleotide (ProFAR) isomerase
VGTAALAGPEALERFVVELGDRLVVAIDVRGGRVAARGWLQDTGLEAAEVARRCAEAGVARILCTAIERDGLLGGPDLELLREVRDASGLPLLAAGGIRSEADLAAVEAVGCQGAVVGRALLDGSLPLSAVA